MKCDYCDEEKRILIARSGLSFFIDGEERVIHTFGRNPKMCLECFSEDLRSEIDFQDE